MRLRLISLYGDLRHVPPLRGMRRFGVPPGGPADAESAALAAALGGSPANAVVELAFGEATFSVEEGGYARGRWSGTSRALGTRPCRDVQPRPTRWSAVGHGCARRLDSSSRSAPIRSSHSPSIRATFSHLWARKVAEHRDCSLPPSARNRRRSAWSLDLNAISGLDYHGLSRHAPSGSPWHPHRRRARAPPRDCQRALRSRRDPVDAERRADRPRARRSHHRRLSEAVRRHYGRSPKARPASPRPHGSTGRDFARRGARGEPRPRSRTRPPPPHDPPRRISQTLPCDRRIKDAPHPARRQSRRDRAPRLPHRARDGPPHGRRRQRG